MALGPKRVHGFSLFPQRSIIIIYYFSLFNLLSHDPTQEITNFPFSPFSSFFFLASSSSSWMKDKEKKVYIIYIQAQDQSPKVSNNFFTACIGWNNYLPQ